MAPFPDRALENPLYAAQQYCQRLSSSTAPQIWCPGIRACDIQSAYYAAGVDDAIETVESLGYDRACIIGGAGIYDLFQPVVDRMVLSRIPGEYDGDAYFPDWNTEEWPVVSRTSYNDFTREEWV